jgi:hypothetical protein
VTQFACRILEHFGLPQPEEYRWMGLSKKEKA